MLTADWGVGGDQGAMRWPGSGSDKVLRRLVHCTLPVSRATGTLFVTVVHTKMDLGAWFASGAGGVPFATTARRDMASPWLLLLLRAATATVHVVPFWTADAGFCKKLPGLPESVHRPHGLDRIHAVEGDMISFTFSTRHDVWSHTSLDALESCDFAEATLVAGANEGGGCADDADLECMGQATPFQMSVEHPGELYLSSKVGNHCANGLRLVVVVRETGSPPPPPPHVMTLGPWWTDDAGYCKPIPQLADDRRHEGHKGIRPTGLETIVLEVGQPLIFQYTDHHDVWQHPTRESYDACDYEGAVMLADTNEGGGCTSDADWKCLEGSRGFELVATVDQVGRELYLSCSVGDHCVNGQKVIVSIISSHDSAGPQPASPFSLGAALGASAALVCVCVLLLVRGAFRRRCPSRSSGVGLDITIPKPGSSDDPMHTSTASTTLTNERV